LNFVKEVHVVGLLIVSHSARLADGVRELAEQMSRGEIPIVAVGGAVDGSLGTSPDQIRAGAEALGPVDGILVLVDLGSAVMCSELALEGFERPYLLSNAPLVEGALLAAVEASVGAGLQQVARAAEQARDLRKVQD
jgi:phosphoenolpyruvate---glycerone phosphotransferase subunit DhaM